MTNGAGTNAAATTPATGTPATGTPATGTPATGTPARGAQAPSTPAAGAQASGGAAGASQAAATAATTAAPRILRNPPGRGSLSGIGLVLIGSVSVQFGSAVAALIFPRAGALGVVSLRITLAAVLLALVCRPRLRGHTRTDWAVVAAFGLALGGMNILFYQAIDRMPLGPAVTLEVLGPLLLSVVAARRALSLVWAGLALAGVFLLGRGGFAGLDAAGAGFALAAGVCWAAYIVFNARAGARFPRLDALAIAMCVAALLSLPLGVASAGGTLLRPDVLGLGLAIALLCSGVPYTLELLALRRLPAATFAVLMSLAPALAALAGFLVLGQNLTAAQCAAIALVVAASTGAVRTGAAGRG